MAPARKLPITTTTTSSRNKGAPITSQATIDTYFAKPALRSAIASKLLKENPREIRGTAKRKHGLDDSAYGDMSTSSAGAGEVRSGKKLKEWPLHARPPLVDVPDTMDTAESSQTCAESQDSAHVKAIAPPSTTPEPQPITPRRPVPGRSAQRIDSGEVIPSSQEPSQHPLIPTHPLRSDWRSQGDRPSLTPRMFHMPQPPFDEIIPDSQATSPERSLPCVNAEDEEVVPSSQTQLMTSVYPPTHRRAAGPFALPDLDLTLTAPNASKPDECPGLGSPTQDESYAPWVKDLLTRAGHREEKTSMRLRQDADVAHEIEEMSGEQTIADMVSEGGGTAPKMRQEHPPLSQSPFRKPVALGSSPSAGQSIARSIPCTPQLTSTRTSSYPPSTSWETPTSQFSFDVTRILPSQYQALPEADSYALPSESFFDGLTRCLQDDSDSD